MKSRPLFALLVWAFVAVPANAAEPGQRAPLPADLAAVPGDAIGFVHIRVADIWKSDALKELRDTVMKAGEKALQGFDKRFIPSPSSIERLTLVLAPRDGNLENEPVFFGILSFSKPFDRDVLLKSSMPNAVEKKTTNGSYWVDAKTAMAVSFANDRVIVLGPVPGVELYIDKRSAGPGALTETLHAADSKRHITVGGNLTLIPQKAHEDVPPPFRPLLRARTALLSFDLKENSQIDLSLNFDDEKAAAAGLVAIQDLAKLGRDFIKKSREEMMNIVLGDGKIAPLEKLPESAMALVALGGMDRLDAFLADPPVKQDRKLVKMSVTTPNLSYTAMAPVAVGLMLPAVQKVREAASRSMSMNNLKQLALAMHNYHDQMNGLPTAAICDKNGKPLLSWRVSLLPYIEQQNLYNQFKLDEPWDSDNNKKLIPLMPKTFLCPQAPNPEPGKTHYRIFYGNDAIFDLKKSLTLIQITDGTSNTGMIFEMDEPTIWTKPDDFEYKPNKPLPKFASFNRAGFNMAFADGSVRFIPHSTPEKTLRLIITANDGEVINLP